MHNLVSNYLFYLLLCRLSFQNMSYEQIFSTKTVLESYKTKHEESHRPYPHQEAACKFTTVLKLLYLPTEISGVLKIIMKVKSFYKDNKHKISLV